MTLLSDLFIDPEDPPAERWANLLTHGLVALVAAVAIVAMFVATVAERDVWRIVGSGVYGVGLLALYVASTCYHACRRDTLARRRWRTIDHAAIYVFIAATYTPLLIVPLRGPWGWSLLAVVWSVAAFGVWLKLFGRRRYGWWSTALYLLMGWVGVIAIRPMLANVPLAGVEWIVAGGLAYTLGVAFYAAKRLPFSHAIWHLFVALGSVCHFVAIRWYVLA